MNYKIKTFIPSLSTFDYFDEIKNLQYLNLNKFISSKDITGIINFLENLIPNSNLKQYDKLFCLIFLRSLCVGNSVTLKFNNKNLKIDKVELKLNVILSQILENKNNIINDFNFEDIKITFKQGKKIYYNSFNDILLDIIDEVNIKDQIENFKDLKHQEKELIVLRLKKEIKKEIKKHIIQMSPGLKISTLEELKNTTINIFNNSAFYFIKTILTSSLSNFYTKIYHTSHKLNLTYDNFLSLTPSETDLILAIYKSQSTIK